MMMTTYSCALTGLDASLVQVEVDLSNGLPRCDIVGLPDSTVQEAKERIRAAIKNSGFEFPVTRITINLAPADLKKEGSGFDLSMALGILAGTGQFVPESTSDFLVLGELGLDGRVRPVPGVLAVAARLQNERIRKLIVPHDNAKEAAVFSNLKIWPVRNLQEAVSVFLDGTPPADDPVSWTPDEEWPEDFEDVKGQEHVKRALEIAAAGNHNILLIGPPGSGKTMLARRFPGILPVPQFPECLEILKVLSIAGMLRGETRLPGRRPFRAPHSNTSYAGMAGGGNPIRPGELTMAHRGVLFMDELPQFHRDVLESLRQPLEEKQITVVRSSAVVTYPADFLLLAAMNPCPCGYDGDLKRNCICSPADKLHYRKRISGPILDRIDLHVEVSALPYDKFYSDSPRERSRDIKARVERARAIQERRFTNPMITNTSMRQGDIERYCEIPDEGRKLLKSAFEKLHYSARGHSKILKVARTIADLAGSESIDPMHLAEALQYRVLDRTTLHE